MDSTSDVSDNCTSRLDALQSPQESKRNQTLNAKLETIEYEFSEKQKTLREYATRAKTLFTSKRKSTLELDAEEATLSQNQTISEESRPNGLRYPLWKKLLLKHRKKTYDIDEYLESNKQELERIQLAIEEIEDDLEENHLKLRRNYVTKTKQKPIDELPDVSNLKTQPPEATLQNQLQQLSKQHADELRKLELRYQQTSIPHEIEQKIELDGENLEANSTIENIRKLKTFVTFTKWRGKAKSFLQELSNGLKPNQTYEIAETSHISELTEVRETSFIRIDDRIIELKVSNEEISIYPEEIRTCPQEMCENGDDKSSKSENNALAGSGGNTTRLTSLSDFEDHSIRSSSRSSFVKEDMTISEMFALFVRRSKGFLKSKYKRKKNSTPELSEYESESEKDTELQTSYETSIETRSEVEDTEDFMSHLAKTSRSLLTLKPSKPRTLHDVSFQNDVPSMNLIDDPQPGTSKQDITTSDGPRGVPNHSFSEHQLYDNVEQTKRLELFSHLSRTSRSLRSSRKRILAGKEEGIENVEGPKQSLETGSKGDSLTEAFSYISKARRRFFAKHAKKNNMKKQADDEPTSTNNSVFMKRISKFTRSGTALIASKYKRSQVNRNKCEEIELKELGSEETKVGKLNTIEEETTQIKSVTSEPEKISATSSKVKENISRINGFKQTVSSNLLQGYLEENKEQEVAIDEKTSSNTIGKIKKLITRTISINKKRDEESDQLDKQHQSAGEILGDLVDVLRNMKESLNEIKERRTKVTIQEVKSDQVLKPLKVYKDYKILPKQAKLQRKRKQSAERIENLNKGDDPFETIETTAIVHRLPDFEPD